MIKKHSIATAFVLASIALPSQAALIATWDLAASVSGSTVLAGMTIDISGGGSGGTATLDDDGTFAFTGLTLNIDAVTAFGGATAAVGASGEINGAYDSNTQILFNNTADIVLTEVAPCAPSNAFGNIICGQIPDLLTFDEVMVLTPSNGLTDPIVFDLENDFSFLLGNIEEIAAFDLFLSNVVLEPVNPIPVPAAAWLFGSALMGLAGIKRRK